MTSLQRMAEKGVRSAEAKLANSPQRLCQRFRDALALEFGVPAREMLDRAVFGDADKKIKPLKTTTFVCVAATLIATRSKRKFGMIFVMIVFMLGLGSVFLIQIVSKLSDSKLVQNNAGNGIFNSNSGNGIQINVKPHASARSCCDTPKEARKSFAFIAFRRFFTRVEQENLTEPIIARRIFGPASLIKRAIRKLPQSSNPSQTCSIASRT